MRKYFLSTLCAIFLLFSPVNSFAGVDCLSTAGSVNFGLQSFNSTTGTIGVWVNPNVVPTSGGDFYISGRNVGGNNNGDIGLVFNSSDQKPRFFIQDGVSTSQADFNSQVTAGVWTHWLGTWDSGEVAIYRDGVKQTSTGSGIALEAHDTVGFALCVLHDATDGAPADVQVSEFFISTAVYTQTEITLVASSRVKRIPLQIQPSSLQIYLPLDDEEDGSSGAGDTFFDLSANGNDGTGESPLTAKAEEILTYP